MNVFNPEDLVDIYRQRFQEEIAAHHLAQKARQGSTTEHWLVTLGIWMVASGEKLQVRYAASVQKNQFELSQDKARKAGA